MAKLSDEKIKEIQELYNTIGIYSEVAKRVGCSPATVKKYASMTPVTPHILQRFSGQICEIKDIKPFSRNELHITEQEYDEIRNLWKEM